MRLHTLGALAALFACACAQRAAGPSPIVAEGDGLTITLEQLDERLKQNLLEERTGGQQTKLFELRSGALDEWIEEQVLTREAERRGMDVDALLDESVQVGPEQIETFFQENEQRLKPGTELADVEDDIRRYLEAEQRRDAVEALVARADVEIHLDPPRIQVAAVGPALGPEDAPVTIIEFGDFECPYCRRAAPVVNELHRRHPEQVRIVYRHLPLDSIHPRARAAAEASACADAQGHFWAYHDELYRTKAKLSDAELRKHAEAVGVDLERYDACIADGSQRETVALDARAARDAGISGTPAFLVNGVLLTGAQPLEVFERMIEREIEAAGLAEPAP